MQPASPEELRETLRKRTWKHPGEKLVIAFLMACAAISLFTTLAIIFTLVEETYSFFKDVSVRELEALRAD